LTPVLTPARLLGHKKDARPSLPGWRL
jgi:hypothetical protein